MNCMKCGQDIDEMQVFCQSCLDDMQKYPVKPNTAIQLPLRDGASGGRNYSAKRRQPPTAEEKLQTSIRFLHRILVLWLITLGLLIASLFPTIKFLLGETFHLPGQNYSTHSTAPTVSTVPTASTVPGETETAPTTP